MNIQINFELSDKEIEYLFHIKNKLTTNNFYDIDYYKLSNIGFQDEHDRFVYMDIIIYNDNMSCFQPTFLYDEILKQLSK